MANKASKETTARGTVKRARLAQKQMRAEGISRGYSLRISVELNDKLGKDGTYKVFHALDAATLQDIKQAEAYIREHGSNAPEDLPGASIKKTIELPVAFRKLQAQANFANEMASIKPFNYSDIERYLLEKHFLNKA